MLFDYENLNPKNIWELEQNKPSLIAKDFSYFGIPHNITYKILLGRGVFKWFAVRRSLIKLKNEWKERIKITIADIHYTKVHYEEIGAYKLGYLRGYLRAMEECRGEVRALCHSSRWSAPDFDKEAVLFLSNCDRNDYS
jgi:hypothetical protein